MLDNIKRQIYNNFGFANNLLNMTAFFYRILKKISITKCPKLFFVLMFFFSF